MKPMLGSLYSDSVMKSYFDGLDLCLLLVKLMSGSCCLELFVKSCVDILCLELLVKSMSDTFVWSPLTGLTWLYVFLLVSTSIGSIVLQRRRLDRTLPPVQIDSRINMCLRSMGFQFCCLGALVEDRIILR